MKTSQIARGIVGALSLAGVIGAVGCAGTDGFEGAAGDGEIGVTSQALSNGSAVKDLADAILLNGSDVNPNPVGIELAAHCKILDGSVTKILSIGGYDSSGNGIDKVYAYTPGSPGTWTQVATLAGVRGLAQAITNPADNTQCVVAGGKTTKSGSTDVATAELIDVAFGTPSTWTVSNAGNVSGFDHALVPCKDANDLIFIGGRLGNGTLKNAILRWDPSITGTTAWPSLQDTASPSNVTLVSARASFAIASQDEATNDKYLIAGGQTAGNAIADDSLEALKVISSNGTCAVDGSATTTTDLSFQGGASDLLSSKRFGAVAFETAYNSGTQIGSVTVVGGNNAAATPVVLNTQDNMTIDWSGTPAFTSVPAVVTPSTPALTAMRYPKVVAVSATNHILVGGELYSATNHAGTTIANTNAIQEYNAAVLGGRSNLVTGRSGHIAEIVSGTIYVGQGRDPSNNFLTTTEAFTP